MITVTYKNSAKDITLEQAIQIYEHGISIFVNDGRDVTFMAEKEPTSRAAK